MEKLTDSAQGYCEMYCKKYGHCFSDPGDCVFHDEVKMYESLKGYECTGMSPGDIKTMAVAALREQEERRWIPVTERLPKYFDHVLINVPGDKPFTTVHEAHLRKDGMWDTGLYRYDREDVTHWMPLPEPPKEDAK